jgi:predicted ABC-type ATPase
MPSSEELIALFGDDFDDVLRGLAQLPPEARELLDGTMGKMLYDADIFDSRVSKAVQAQGASGMSAAAISAGLASDMATGGPVFGEIRNTIKGSLVEGINQTGRAGSYQAYDADDKTLFVWVTVAGHKICQDCSPLGGQRQTMKEWENQGTPGSGWSVCKGSCYCILDPSGKISPTVEAERERGEIVKAAGPLEKEFMKKYSLTADQTASYKRFMKLDSSTAMQMMKRKRTSRVNIIRQSTSARRKLLGATDSIDRNTVNGNLTNARKKVHEKIINQILTKGRIKDKVTGKWIEFDLPIAKAGKQELLTTGGYPGSGKSTMLDQIFPGWQKKFVHLDSDRIKELLAMADGVELRWRAPLYHAESKILLNKIKKMAIEQNRHILYDATMKTTDKFIKAIKLYKDSGYKVTAAFADLPIEQAMERAIARFLGESGRFVDPVYIITHGNQNIATFNELKRIVNSWSQYSTNVPIKAPALFIDGYP